MGECDYAETFPATLDRCKICGGEDVRIVNVTYFANEARAYYLCQRCRCITETRQYRKLRRTGDD